MGKIFLRFFCFILIISCNSDDDLKLNITPENEMNTETESFLSLKYTLKESFGSNNIIHTQEYAFDEEGKVILENYTNLNNPQNNHFSVFEYNDEGKVTKEIRGDQTQYNILWNNNLAEVFNLEGDKISEFEFFDDGRLKKYTYIYSNGSLRIRKYNYDTNQNIITIENETEIILGYLEYDITTLNPFYFIKSIGILRIDYNPFYKNIFGIEKIYPSTFYNYNYVFDTDNRVYQIENERTPVYTKEFSYEE